MQFLQLSTICCQQSVNCRVPSMLSFLVFLFVIAATICSTRSADVEIENLSNSNNNCKVRIPLDGDTSRIVEYTEENPDTVDYSVHQWCASHNIIDSSTCNELRNFFLNRCFPSYLNDFHGPIYTITINDNSYNIQAKKIDSHLNISIDRFCSLHTPTIDPASPKCVEIKISFMNASSSAAHPSSLLDTLYQEALTKPSDVRDHIADHVRLAQDCDVVMEIGVRGMISTWGILYGLNHNKRSRKKYIGVDLYYPAGVTWLQFEGACEETQVECVFMDRNDMTLVPEDIGPVDMLFIDALHTYSHVMYELTTFHTQVRKYIALHDTSAPWGAMDEPYSGDYSEYPAWIDRTKRGVFTAVQDFLAMHPTEWVLTYRKENSHGYTLLERVQHP